jgi:hypothetical protein
MEPQTVTIEVTPQTAAMLQAKATAKGVSLDELLLSVLEAQNGIAEERLFYETATPDELAAEIQKWMDSHDPSTPALPLEAVSRESIYSDR